MNRIEIELSDTAGGVEAAAAEIDGMKDIAPVTVAQQLNQIMTDLTGLRQDMIQIRQDMKCWCAHLPHLFREQG